MLAFVTLLIVYGSLYPWSFNFHRGAASPLWILLHAWPRVWNRFIIRDAIFNVAVYVPLGAAAYRSLVRRVREGGAMAGAVFLGLALSACLEMLQIYVPGRDCSLLDVVTNTTGAAAGALCLAVWRVDLERRFGEDARERRRRPAAPLVLLACWAGFEWYPFFPALARTPLNAGISALLHGLQFRPAEVCACTAEWFAVAVLMEACWPRIRGEWVALALTGCFARLLIHGRVLAAEEVVGAALALWLWMVSRERRRPAWAAGMLAVAILLRELSPFRFVPFPAPISWVPFAASMRADREPALLMLLRKAFDYGAFVWLLSRSEVPYRITAPALAAALLVCEWIQRYIPGRTPETTDAVLAALMAALLAALARWDDRTQQYEL